MSTVAEAKRAALAAGAIAGIMSTLDAATRGEWPKLRVGIGAAIAAGALSLIADKWPDIAAGFAGLIIIAALLGTGARVVPRITQYFAS